MFFPAYPTAYTEADYEQSHDCDQFASEHHRDARVSDECRSEPADQNESASCERNARLDDADVRRQRFARCSRFNAGCGDDGDHET